MLNLSPHNSISNRVLGEHYNAFQRILPIRSGVLLARILMILSGLILIIMFLPWTQVVHGHGEITGKNPQQRPQQVPAVVPGRIEKWYVREGTHVKPGDTIVVLSEVKNRYFDPKLLERTESRVNSKEAAYKQYQQKVKNLEDRIQALKQNRELKLEQLKNKRRQAELRISSDSVELEAAKTDLRIAKNQLERFRKLQKKGLKSLSELQDKQLKLRSARAKKISAENKLLSSRNELINVKLERRRAKDRFRSKITKARSELNNARSKMNNARASITKLDNELSNYRLRSRNRVIKAPQKGRVTKIAKAGIGEIIQQGERIVSIMPDDPKLAVELYVRPVDYPLLYKGEKARLQFDGWPSIVFSGWPNISHGTFKGEIYAIDRYASKNGKFRIMIEPSENADWPDALRAGSGAKGMIILETVPVWYEIWRKLNGFPPNFYKPDKKKGSEPKKGSGIDRPKINVK